MGGCNAKFDARRDDGELYPAGGLCSQEKRVEGREFMLKEGSLKEGMSNSF
jgi:hypothetical protein